MMANYRISFLCLSLAACFLMWAAAQRIGHTYLEDDMLWFIPSVENTLHTQSFYDVLKSFHASEMTLFDGMYFSFFVTFIGHHFPVYAYASFICHFLNAAAFFIMLVLGLRLSQGLSLLASLIYLTFYGHYHAYLWPIASHHLWVLLLTFIIMTLYLIADRRLDENKNIAKIYGWMVVLALCAGLNRLSILVLPLMMVLHIAFTNNNTLKLADKVRRWLPVFYLLTVYQVIIVFFGGHQDVLIKILPQHPHQWSWPAALLIAAGWAVFILFLYGAIGLIVRVPHSSRMIPIAPTNKLYFLNWPWYGLLFFSYPLGLCCYTWFAPMASVESRGVFQRWQPMALPEGILAHIGWWLLGTVLLFYLIRTAVVRRDLLIFLVWYLFLMPFLAFYGENIPSRYLIYVSPVLAVSLALLWHQIKWKWIKTVTTAGLVFLMALNIWAIHARSLSSWTTDYRWSYDFIKYAHFIKADLIQKGIKPSDASLCVQNAGPMPYLNGWRGWFLSNDFDGFSPLIDITESVLGSSPRSFKINKPCASENQRYDALIMNSAGIKILDGPIHGNGLELFAQDYDPDLKIIQNDRLIYQDSVLSKPLNFPQGHLIGAYKGFSIFYFGEYYFVVPGKDFNLIQFKTNSYVREFAAKTLWEVRQWVDEKRGISAITNMFPQAPASFILTKSYVYRLSCLGIPIGHWQWQTKEGYVDQKRYTYSIFTFKPWAWLTHHYGYVYKTILDQNFLPIRSQEGSLDKFKKNLVRTIIYNHHQGFMRRRGYEEDILSDTRDLAGLLTWGLKQNYQQGGVFRTSFHEGRNLYQCEVIPVKSVRDKIFINIHISRIRRDLTIRPWGTLEARLIHQGDINLPVQLILKFGFLHIPIDFNYDLSIDQS